ncbi:hypothetical protein Cs308_0807 [Candidatus Chlamydia sanziniae]|uniref:Uncharacterized protein n=2 Tax=Candidatus Chlamydia sanziniae TaxID=1806891 RepID=A0A1A9HWA5_9CHLA|nr:hypothetical protein Cs308_0807 [Candidatus Chlamydia sanziniae]
MLGFGVLLLLLDILRCVLAVILYLLVAFAFKTTALLQWCHLLSPTRWNSWKENVVEPLNTSVSYLL